MRSPWGAALAPRVEAYHGDAPLHGSWLAARDLWVVGALTLGRGGGVQSTAVLLALFAHAAALVLRAPHAHAVGNLHELAGVAGALGWMYVTAPMSCTSAATSSCPALLT